MEFPYSLRYGIEGLPNAVNRTITLYAGLTTLVGPNGSGKTQILRSLRAPLMPLVPGRRVRLLSASRLYPLDLWRIDHEGRYQRGLLPYDNAQFGNKNDQTRRLDMETAQGDFQTLALRQDLQVKVATRLKCLFQRDIMMDWENGQLKVRFAAPSSNGVLYSAAREASGLLELVSLLTALYNDEIGALLIDEPEASLHPQLQAFLLGEIRRVAGKPDLPGKKLVLMATHSTEMIDVRRPEDLASMVFCSGLDTDPRQIAPDADELRSRGLCDLLARLGQEHKLAFFCRRPLLIEGPSDAIICAGLDRRLDLHLAAAGAQLVPVIGKGAMPAVAKLMRLIGKAPIILADADAIADCLDLVSIYTTEPSVIRAAHAEGHTDASAFARSVHSTFCQMVSKGWADIAPLAEKHPYWSAGHPPKDDQTRQRRAAFATLMSMPTDELEALPDARAWAATRDQIAALLDFLEAAGCFVLRRGTIEEYYKFANREMSGGKPSAAVAEVEGISAWELPSIEEQYDDVLRALRFAASVDPINEVQALRVFIIAVAAAALGMLTSETSEGELNLAARHLFGDKASLVRLVPEHRASAAPELVVHLKSAVLDVSGFPIRLHKGCDPEYEVDRQLIPGVADSPYGGPTHRLSGGRPAPRRLL